jgi:putative transposase
VAGYRISQTRATRLLQLNRSTYYYRSVRRSHDLLRRRLSELAAARPLYGYRRLYVLLRREGWQANKKLIYRLYTEESLTMRRKRPRRRLRSALHRRTVALAKMPDHRWSMDFMADQLAGGDKIRLLTIVDHFSRESPSILVGRRFSGEDVVRALERLRRCGRKPKTITTDNGSEFASKLLDQWAYVHGVELDFIEPGKPVQNAIIESFNGRLRAECLNASWFETIDQAQRTVEAWRLHYNSRRPHGSLGQLSPREYRQRWTSQQGAAIKARF